VLTAALVSNEPAKGKDKDCKPTEETNVGKATAGGYEVNYKSGMSPSCRVYSIRNTKGGLTTRVKWTHKDELFIEWKLPSCMTDDCAWKDATTLSDFSTKDDSSFGFGANPDEHEEKPMAYCEDKAKPKPKPEEKTLGATLKGSVATDGDNERFIDITVTSKVADSDTLLYTIRAGEKSANVGLPDRFSTDEPGLLHLRWEAVETPEFLRRMGDQKTKYVGKENPTVAIKIVGKNREVRKGELRIYYGKEVVAATTAYAYVPTKE
jgi:hypothetical protein